MGFWNNDKYNGKGIFYKSNREFISDHWEDWKKQEI